MNIRTEGRTRVAPSHPFAPTSLRGLLAGLAILALTSVPTPLLADHPTVTVGSLDSGPITFFGSSPLPAGRSSISLRFEHIDLDRYSDETLEAFGAVDNHAHSIDSTRITHLSFSHGISSDLTIGLHLPYIERDNVRAGEDNGGMVEVENDGSPSGVGDLRLFGMYRLMRDSSRSAEVSVIGGVKFPTGETEEESPGGELIGLEHQPGTGSVDFTVGAAASKRLREITLHASALGTLTTEGDRDTELGNRFDWGLGASMPVVRNSLRGGPQVTVDVTLELTGEVEGKVEEAGSKDRNSGGNRIFLSPGFRVTAGERFSFFGAVGFPVVDDPNGDDHETDLRVLVGVSATF